jgi:hypothetical protein
MKFVTLAAAGLALLGASPAFAQYGAHGPVARPTVPGQEVAGAAQDTLALAGSAAIGTSMTLVQYGPFGPVMRPAMPIAGMPGNEVIGMVREMGLDPIGPPTRSGNFYIQRAADYYGRPMQVIVDARRAQVVSVEALNAPGSIQGAPYAAANARYAPPPYARGGYPGYGAPYDGDMNASMPAPQGARSAPRADLGPAQADLHRGIQPMPLPQHVAPKPVTKSAAITPGKPPVPRKRPAVAPQETAGTVEPLQAKPEAAPAAPSTAAPATEAKPSAPATPAAPAAPAMPPVAPLE